MKYAILPCLLLAACGPKPPIAVQIREIQVPTPVPCTTADKLPAEPPKIGDKLTGNAVVDLPIVAASALELRRWGQEQAAILTGCVE